MCQNFYDIRTFGALMTTFVKASLNCGQVRGPVQLGFARSIDPIISQEVTITRVAITTEKDAENKSTEMGRKSIVPYGLYRVEGYVSANLARKVTGFSEEDLELLWEAIINMFENDHSAARGKMAVRELIVLSTVRNWEIVRHINYLTQWKLRKMKLWNIRESIRIIKLPFMKKKYQIR